MLGFVRMLQYFVLLPSTQLFFLRLIWLDSTHSLCSNVTVFCPSTVHSTSFSSIHLVTIFDPFPGASMKGSLESTCQTTTTTRTKSNHFASRSFQMPARFQLVPSSPCNNHYSNKCTKPMTRRTRRGKGTHVSWQNLTTRRARRGTYIKT